MRRRIVFLIAIFVLALPLHAQDEMMSPGVQVSDQVSLNGAVVIDSVYSDGPGFIVIHADNGSGGPGPVIGYRQLNAGSNHNVSVDIDTAGATPTLFAMLHVDTGEVGVYEFQQVEGADGPARDANDAVITPPFNIDLIDAKDQLVVDNTVTVAAVVAQADGWMVIHTGPEGRPGPVGGYAPVTAGLNTNVVVTLDMLEATEMVFPMLHVDTGEAGVYEFQQVEGADGPVRVNDVTAVTPIWTVPHMRVADQIVVHADGMAMSDMAPTLTAESVLAAEPGWLVIHVDSGENSPGPVAGFAPVQPGTNLDVVVELDPALVTPRLFPMLHVDTGAAGEYEFGTVEGADGPVRDSADNVIVFGINAAPSISFEGELREGGLFITSALIDSGGWMAIHSGAEGSPGPVLGAAPLHPGLNRNIFVSLDPAAAGALVFPMLHVDSGAAGVYEFQQVEGADGPVRVGEAVVVGPMELTPLETMAEEPAAEAMAGCEVSSGGTVNLRQGPGTNFNVAGSLNAGTSIAATGQAQGTDGIVWWNLADGSWVRSDVVNASGDCAALPQAESSAVPAAAPVQPAVTQEAAP